MLLNKTSWMCVLLGAFLWVQKSISSLLLTFVLEKMEKGEIYKWQSGDCRPMPPRLHPCSYSLLLTFVLEMMEKGEIYKWQSGDCRPMPPRLHPCQRLFQRAHVSQSALHQVNIAKNLINSQNERVMACFKYYWPFKKSFFVFFRNVPDARGRYMGQAGYGYVSFERFWGRQ